MKIVKINHTKQFDNAGCVYQRGFNINCTILTAFYYYLEKRVRTEKDYYKLLYLKCEITALDNCRFMNLTQTVEFIKFMRKNKMCFSEQRANLKANGYLIINKY